MRSFEIFVLRAPNTDPFDDVSLGVPSSSLRARSAASDARDVLDIFIEGANVTAKITDSQALFVLRDLGNALAELALAPLGKAIVRFYDEPWELCVERLGSVAALSVYRAGAEPEVLTYDRTVPFGEVVSSVLAGIDDALRRGDLAPATRFELEVSSTALGAVDGRVIAASPEAPPLVPIALEAERDAPISFATEFLLRSRPQPGRDAGVERADLHALLFRGRLRAEVRGRPVDLGETHPFLVAERLVELARGVVDAWERGRSSNVRVECHDVVVGMRMSKGSAVALTLGALRGDDKAMLSTFPNLAPPDVVEAALAFGRGLVRAILRRDRAQATNLRMSSFRRKLRELGDALREVQRQDAKVNPEPERYRVFAESLPERTAKELPLVATRLRYGVRWRALVPGIDLRSTFLCGDRLVVGSAAETFCLDRVSGEVLWRIESQKATSVVTPGGLARIHGDGSVVLHDFGNGEINLRTRIVPRVGGPPTGAVVNVPGLPRLLIVTEGERHFVAIDLRSGEHRWRYPWGQRGVLRLKRAGKLLYVTSGDSALTALDVLTGAVVWRVRDRLRFRAAPTLDRELLFAVAGGVNSAAQLHAIDPFSGHTRWSGATPTADEMCTVEGAPLVAGGAVVVGLRERHGLRLVAFHRKSGEPCWSHATPMAPIGTS